MACSQPQSLLSSTSPTPSTEDDTAYLGQVPLQPLAHDMALPLELGDQSVTTQTSLVAPQGWAVQGPMVVGVHAQQLQGTQLVSQVQGKNQQLIGLRARQLQAHTGEPMQGSMVGVKGAACSSCRHTGADLSAAAGERFAGSGGLGRWREAMQVDHCRQGQLCDAGLQGLAHNPDGHDMLQRELSMHGLVRACICRRISSRARPTSHMMSVCSTLGMLRRDASCCAMEDFPAGTGTAALLHSASPACVQLSADM